MYKGGSNYTSRSAKIIKYAGLLVPVILILYGLLIQIGYVESLQYYNDVTFVVISFWWLLISLLQFLVPSASKRDSAFRLVSFHILAAAYLLLVSGVSTPFAAFWILLMLASNTYFDRTGLNLSILSFCLVVGIDIYLLYDTNQTIALYDLVILVAIILSGLVTLSISKAQNVDHLALKRSREQENLQRERILTIVNNLADAILSTDEEGIIRVYNAASLNLLDTNDSLNGKYIDDVVALLDGSDQKISLYTLLKGSKSATSREDLKYIYDQGEKIRLEVTYSPIRSGFSSTKKSESHDGYIIIMRDITKSKSLEEERDEFISVISHELRTPIAIVEGTVSNAQIMMSHPDTVPQMLEDAMNVAHDQIIYLARMVNDLSTLSRAERGVADAPEDIDVKEMIHKLHDQYNPEATAKGLHLNLDLSPLLGHVYASRLYLEEVLQNFITNSIKYTKKGSITIIAKQRQGVITFSVKDTGIGITKSDQAKVFQKFYRSEDYRTRETSGTGLGLYVTEKLANKLGITIELVSRINYGSTFSFKLKVKNPKE